MPGGKRKGAGRKPVPNKKINKNITLRPDHIKKMAGEKVSSVIEMALDEYFRGDNMEKSYEEMYTEAAEVTSGNYEGYTGANALSKYVDDKYNINAAANGKAHGALCDAMHIIDDSE